jgi:hypothetical protein
VFHYLLKFTFFCYRCFLVFFLTHLIKINDQICFSLSLVSGSGLSDWTDGSLTILSTRAYRKKVNSPCSELKINDSVDPPYCILAVFLFTELLLFHGQQRIHRQHQFWVICCSDASTTWIMTFIPWILHWLLSILLELIRGWTCSCVCLWML